MDRREPSARGTLSPDTSADAEALQIQRWREMSDLEKADLIRGACRAARAMALAGIRARHPDAPDSELIPRFAALTLGVDVARLLYPRVDFSEDGGSRGG
jgi:hypothetical protein